MDDLTDAENSDTLSFMPLGSGQEVGRSCHFLSFKGKNIMLDCGIHPGMHNFAALPFVDLIDAESLDLILITHFHLDHCGALPWFLNKTGFRGRCFMTHATKGIYRMMLGDYIKMSKYGSSSDKAIFSEQDLERSLEKIEVIDFHEQKEVNGIRFWPYVAGHVLGAAMFMIEIAGIKLLYTGDYSVLEDRHLCAAEVPAITPDILVCEATCGTQIHEGREERENRFITMVHEIVSRGGRCLIPVFALGRAQELMLILDEYWEKHPELHDIPVYYASSLAKKCMAVYQTFVSGMNQVVKNQISSTGNPFVFKHILNLKTIDHFDDVGPCVVLASPGMLQNGLSRELFELWCPDSKNGCIIAGYCVEGTLAKHILSEPEEIVALAGHKLPMRLEVGYFSFTAHADYKQTSKFIDQLRPAHLILVHGEMNEMNRLKAAISRTYEDDPEYKIEVHNPRNTETLNLYFRGQKTAKVVGELATKPPIDNNIISGILLKRNYNFHLLMPSDLSVYTELSTSTVSERKSLYYNGRLPQLMYNLGQLTEKYTLNQMPKSDSKKEEPDYVIKMFDNQIELKYYQKHCVILMEWLSTPVTDMYSDAIMSAILHAQTNHIPLKHIPKPIKDLVKEAQEEKDLKEPIEHKLDRSTATESRMNAFKSAIREICGAVEIVEEENILKITVDGKEATLDTTNMQIQCSDLLIQHLLGSVCQKVSIALAPI
ncbi:unnamed protein product [Bursaphelenchus okinawaensis]|uniref:Cleavage and polyadenylation specificity factor subunit 3 n=1 Tax=Bursaphelenchus okinawaensis TaxID=465554 RepID=A0A811LKU2_9BILA|nr:unnamed protein product [Bursaphelenchus okinawaensis]CAG9124298.1 unnamed protein product [Bursaphelenchus okinawaensis]